MKGLADFDAAMTDIRAPLGPPPQARSPARDFPVRRLFLQPSAPVPALPGSSSDTPAWASSLVAQISDIHQNMVTRTFLEQNHQAQTEELKTYIDAEVSSVRNCVDDLQKNAIISVDRVDKLEIEISKLREQLSSTPSSSSPAFRQMSATLKRQQWSLNKNDVAHKCMSIIGFADEPPDARHNRIEGLMSESLSQFEWVNIDSIMTGPFADNKSQPKSPTLSSILRATVMLL